MTGKLSFETTEHITKTIEISLEPQDMISECVLHIINNQDPQGADAEYEIDAANVASVVVEGIERAIEDFDHDEQIQIMRTVWERVLDGYDNLKMLKEASSPVAVPVLVRLADLRRFADAENDAATSGGDGGRSSR